jgi:hypothetical protein
MRKSIRTLAPIAVACLATGTGLAATITTAGSISGTEVNEWRTAGTAKTADIDGDDVYGTYGSVQWLVAGLNEHPGGSTNAGWSYQGGGSQFSIPGSAVLDANTGAADVQSSIALNNFTFELTGVPSTYAGRTVRVGIMQDMLSSAEWAADVFKGLRIVQTVGGSGDSGIVSVRGGAIGDGVPEMYFFDIAGVNPGDRFRIDGLGDIGGTTGGQPGYLGPVSFDLVAVPEPDSAVLGALGIMLVLRRGSRVRGA